MTKRVLLVAFEFPPSNGASIQRIVSVYKKFLKEGWIVDILTATPFSYPKIQKGSEKDLPLNAQGRIMRAFSLDALEQIGYRGKHFSSLITPDRWGLTWYPSAMLMGSLHLAKHNIDLVWSSAPIPTVHKLGKKLAKQAGAKWIADYRDPLPYMHSLNNGVLDTIHKKIDRETMENADLVTFATTSTMELYSKKYLNLIKETLVVENGFDPDNFTNAENKIQYYKKAPFRDGFVSFYYAGVLYENGRDPLPIFEGLSDFKKNNPQTKFEFIFQGSGDGLHFKDEINRLGLTNDIFFLKGVSIEHALCNMILSDVLVLIQDERFNNQVPGKLYEYLASGRTLLLKTPKGSATDNVALPFKGVFCSHHNNSINNNIYDIFKSISTNAKTKPNWDRFPDILKHSRETQSQILFKKASDICDNNGLNTEKLQGVASHEH